MISGRLNSGTALWRCRCLCRTNGDFGPYQPHCTAQHHRAPKARQTNRKNPASAEPVDPVPVICDPGLTEAIMDGIIYLVGLIVIVMAILSFFGLR
jgi:hypothetical protein